MKKVTTFTLSELLVVLVISSIVVTVSFLALSNVQNRVRNITFTFEKQQNIGKLERWLHSDLNRYTATYHSTTQTLKLTNSIDSVSYLFKKNSVYRNLDSIPLSVVNATYYLDGKKVNSGVVDAVEFLFSNTYIQRSFFVYKKKDAVYYINL